MKKIVFVLAACLLMTTGTMAAKDGGSHSVRGYTKDSGVHVSPHHATNRNNTKNDNWSTVGNVNPHTGKRGTKSRD